MIYLICPREVCHCLRSIMQRSTAAYFHPSIHVVFVFIYYVPGPVYYPSQTLVDLTRVPNICISYSYGPSGLQKSNANLLRKVHLAFHTTVVTCTNVKHPVKHPINSHAWQDSHKITNRGKIRIQNQIAAVWSPPRHLRWDQYRLRPSPSPIHPPRLPFTASARGGGGYKILRVILLLRPPFGSLDWGLQVRFRTSE